MILRGFSDSICYSSTEARIAVTYVHLLLRYGNRIEVTYDTINTYNQDCGTRHHASMLPGFFLIKTGWLIAALSPTLFFIKQLQPGNTLRKVTRPDQYIHPRVNSRKQYITHIWCSWRNLRDSNGNEILIVFCFHLFRNVYGCNDITTSNITKNIRCNLFILPIAFVATLWYYVVTINQTK